MGRGARKSNGAGHGRQSIAPLGSVFSLYDALSYSNSRFQDDYQNGTTTVRTARKKLPGSPAWLNKTVATLTAGPGEIQLVGDHIGRRYAIFTNDLRVGSSSRAS